MRKRGLLPFLLLTPFLWGCGSLVGTAPEAGGPGPTPAPRVRVPVSPPEPLSPSSDVPAHPPVTGALDPILDSPWARDPALEREIQRWMQSLQTREAPRLRRSLVRMGRYRTMVEEEIRRRKLPLSLLYLPIVESWYSPRAVSWVGAAGLWQFMAPTARGMGLQVDRLMDQRRDPFLSTPRALDYLAELRDRFGSWFLALAAYNGGPGRMQRILRSLEGEGEGHDGLFLTIRSRLPRETRNFVPRFLAVARIARNPGAYGFGDVIAEGPLVFDQVEVPDATSLDVVARAAGVELAAIEELNPHLLLGLTPSGRTTALRVPPGRGEPFRLAYREIPPEERVTFLEHQVIQGETLTHIARLYGVRVSELRAANPRIEPRRMQIGQRVIVPKAPSVRDGLRADAGSRERNRLLVYQVRSGDTLSAIASRHRVGVTELLRWNELELNSIIRPGDEVRIYLPGG